MPTARLLALLSEFLEELVRSLSPILIPNNLTQLPPLLVPPLRLIQVPLHHSKLPQIDRSNGAPLIALRRPFGRLYRRRKRKRLLRPRLRIREKSGGRGWRFIGGEARRGILLREGDGEIVHQNDGVAAAGWADAEGLEEEGGCEEMVVFGFVEVAESFARVLVRNAVCSKGTPTFKSSPDFLIGQPLAFPFLHPLILPPLLLLQQRRNSPHQLLLRGLRLQHVLIRIKLPQLDANANRLAQHPRPLPLIPLLPAQLVYPFQTIAADNLQHKLAPWLFLCLLVKESDLDLDAEHLLAKRVETHFIGQFERLSVILQSVLGLDVDVGIVEGAAQFSGYWLRVGFEVVDDVTFIDDVDID